MSKSVDNPFFIKVMNMEENKLENKAEHIPTKDEVMEVIGKCAEGASLVCEFYDDKGLIYLESKVESGVDGEYNEIIYIRKGNHDGHAQSLDTAVQMIYYVDGIPVGGDKLFEYEAEKGEWNKI